MELTTSGLSLFLLICGLLGAARAGPISWDDSKCSTKCSSGSDNFKYEPGKTYVYSYLSRTNMGLADSRQPGSPAEIRAKVEIHVKDPCEMVLKLSEVSLSGTDQGSSFKRALEASPLPFSFHDGDIREVCPTAQDRSKPFVLNTKRAILSVLQNTMKNLDTDQEVREVDIAGDCLTKYTSAKGWSGVTITKSKELSSCRQRQKGIVDVYGKPYNVKDSTIENSPLLAGKLECKQVVSTGGILQNAECEEKNVFHPLSASGKEVAVSTEIKLTFKEERDGAPAQPGKVGRRTTLLFSTGKVDSQELSGDGSQVRQLLQNLCPSGKVAVQFKSPDMVAKLVAHLRVLNYETLTRIYEELDRKQLCPSEVAKDIFVDSLAMAGTEAPVKLMVKLAKEDKLSTFRQKIWLTAMAFNSHADEGVIRATMPLLKDYDLGGRHALLSLSSMVHGFCANYSRHDSEEGDCEDIPVIKELLALLQKQLGDKCKTSDRQEEQKVRETLAAFENIGRVGDAEDTLVECISNKENPLEVRHAAISAFRRTPCEGKITRKLESLFQDASEDSAVRIYAYIGAMSCPDAQLVKAVQETLQKEQVQQVGAYVMSHLRNSKETSSPVKQDLQRLLNDVTLNQKFPSDPRKFSQYMETSAFSSKLNAGAEFEGHLVRNEKTFVPKYVALNMTTYAMGHEINLLELGFEMDGLTYWLEKMFGEEGYMNEVTMEQILKKLGIKEEDSEAQGNSIGDDEEGGDRSRPTRDVKSGSLSRINLLHERMGVTTPNDPKMSGHLYLLGRKFAMGYESDIQKLFQVQEAFSIMEIMTELAQKQKVERSFSFPVVDTELTVPSYSGMELKLAVNATAMLGLVAEGKFDIRNLFTSERGLAIDGHFSPSCAVEVEALMSLDSGVQKSAIKIQATGHTSHYIEGKLDIKHGRIFNLQVNTPKDKIELLTFKSDIFVVKPGEEEKPLTPPALNRRDRCSKYLERALGIDICVATSDAEHARGQADPRPFELEVTLKKTDTSLRAYTLQVELPDEHDYKQLKYKAEFDTPGSSADRHFLLEAMLDRQNEEQTLNYKILSPFKQLEGTASYLGRPDQKKARLSLTMDQKDTYSVQGELKTIMTSGSTELQPSLEFHPPLGEPFVFKGSVTYNAGKKDQLVIDLNSNRPLNNPSYLRGTIVKEGEFNTRNLDGRLKLSTDISLLTPLIEARLHGTGDKQNTVYSSDMALTYKIPGKSEHNAKLIAKVQNLSTQYLSKYSTKMEATFSQLPEANALFSWDFQHKPKAHLENDLKISVGTHYLDEEGEILHFLQVSKIQGIEENGRKGETENRLLLNLPVLLESEVDLNVKTSWNVAGEGKDLKPSFKVNADFKYQKDKHVQAALNYNYISSKPVEMEIEAKFFSPKHEFLYQDRVKERSPNEYEGKTMVQWARDKRANIEYVYRIKTDSSKVHHELDLQLNTPLSRLPLHHKALLRVTRDSIDVRSHTKYEGRPVYTIDAKLARTGLSKIDISAFDVEGELEVNNDDQAKSAKFEVKNKANSWNYGVFTEFKSDRAQRSMTIQGNWNEKQDPSNSFSLAASLIKPSPRSKLSIKGRFRKDTIVDIQGDFDKNAISGTHDLSLEMMAPKMKPVRLTYHHEMDGKTARCLLRYTRNNVQQLEVSSHVKVLTGNVVDLSAGVELKSPNVNWDGKELSASYKHERRSQNYLASLKAQNSPDKPYALDMEYTTEHGPSKKIRARAVLATPVPKHRLQGALVEIETSKNNLKVTTDVTREDNKVLEAELRVQGTLAKGSGNVKLTAPFKSFKSLKAGVEVDKADGYTAQSFLEVNDDRMLEWDSKVEYKGSSCVESTVSLRSAIGPKYDVNVHVLSDEDKKNFELDMKKEDEDFFATTFLLETPGEDENAQLVIKNKGKTWTLEAKKRKTGPESQVYSLSSRGVTKPIEITLTWNEKRNDEKFKLRVCHDSDCLEGEGYRSKVYKERGSWTYRTGLKAHHKPGEEISLDYTLVSNPDLFQVNLLADLWGKKFGYEGALETGDKKEGRIIVKLPSRELRSVINWKGEGDATKINMEFLSDALRQPSRKLTVSIDHKSTKRGDATEIHSSIAINHPDLSQPITAEVEGVGNFGRVEPGTRPLDLKAQVDYSPDPKKKLYGQLYIEAIKEPKRDNITFYVDLHSEDRQQLDTSIRVHLGGEHTWHATAGSEWNLVIPGKAWKGSTFLDLNFDHNEIHYYYRSPRKQWETHTTWEGKDQDLTIESLHIEKDQVTSLKLEIDGAQPCFELTVQRKSDSPTSRYKMCVDVKRDQLLSLTMESYEGSEKVTDAKIVLNRQDERSFSAHVHWRPEKLGELLHGLMTLSDNMDSGSNLRREILQLAEYIRKAAADAQGSVVGPMAKWVASEASLVSQELSSDFKHIENAASRVWSRLPDWDESWSHVAKALENIAGDMKQLVDDLTPKALDEFLEKVSQYIKDLRARICGSGTVCYNLCYAYERKGLEGVGEYVYGVIENMPESYYKIAVATRDLILENLSMPSVSWEPLKEALQSIGAWCCEQMKPLLQSKAVQEAKEKLAEYLEMLKKNWREGVQAIKDDILEQLKKLEKLKMVKELFQGAEWEKTKGSLHKMAELLESLASDFMKQGALTNALRVMTFDPEHGKIDIEVKLPKSPEEIKNVLKASNPFSKDDSDKEMTGTLDAVTYAQAALKQEWIPPFKAHAQLIGGQHYVTFDSTFYDFAGKCSYLLARDFADGNFSVVVKYEGQGNKGTGSIDKSIIVVAGDKVIEIDPEEETVQVDEQDVELPYSHGPVTVLRRGSTVVVEYKRGLSVTCHLLHDYCTTAISGWYYGKTAGLFGTYDHEPSNDFLRPKGQQAQNAMNFARSWEVSSGCRFRNLAQEAEVDPRDPRFDVCRKAFKDSDSPLQPCFQELKEEEYMNMCMRQVAIQRSASEAMCTVAAAFAHVCRQKHFPVSLPHQCLKCQSKSGDGIEYGSRRRLQPGQVTQSSDVVFVVEERQCNNALVKELDSISRLVDHALLDAGLTQNRYGLVAFGGQGRESPAHSHTARGKIFFDQKDLVLATARMTFKKDRSDGDRRDPDTFQALAEAIRYPFRVGASKTLVLVTCSRCDEDAMTVSYPDIQHLLLQRGIVLHTLSPRSISVRKSSTKAKSIYGMDAQRVYTSKDRKLEGDPDLRAQVSYPKDVCLALAQEVGGSFYTTQPVTNGSPNEAKNWKSQLGKRMALTAQPHPCQQCDCAASEDDVPRALCAPCRPPKPARTISNLSDDDDEY